MRECKHKQSMCSYIDWKKDDLALQVNHLMNNFHFTGFELEYTTLGPEENRRLCKIGRRLCGTAWRRPDGAGSGSCSSTP